MKKSLLFRKHHLQQFIIEYENHPYPLDLSISNYFRKHKALGSKDRKWLLEKIYTIIRWKALIDFYCDSPKTWPNRLKLLETTSLKELQQQNLPLHIKCSFPQTIFHRLSMQYGEEKAFQTCLTLNTQAPTTLRTNISKVSRTQLIDLLREQIETSNHILPTPVSPVGIQLSERTNLTSLDLFKKGYFEIQDEASQLAAQLVQAKPKQQVLDYCSGSGGKALAIAPYMEDSGQLYLHDIRLKALQDAKKRLKRAGIQHAQIILPNSPHLSRLKEKMDWVIVDAPCTGSGTYRRNPDMKWLYSEESLNELCKKQWDIVKNATNFVKSGGKLVYMTCSIFQEENENQIKLFAEKLPLVLENKPFKTLPKKNGMDGFFAAVFKRI